MPQLRFVFGVLLADGSRALLELRERHRDLVAFLNDSESEGVGAVMHIWKRGTALNSPVDVEFKRWETLPEWDISGLIPTLGLPAHLVESKPELTVACTTPERAARSASATSRRSA
jgi:hypothetical protein